MATGRTLRREVLVVAAVGLLVAVIVAVGLAAVLMVTLSSIQGATSSRSDALHAPAPGGGASGSPTVDSAQPPTGLPITLRSTSDTAAPNAIVHLRGLYRTAAGRQTLYVQLRRHHAWIMFPIPALTGTSGRYQAFVALAHGGPNRLRMIDRETGHVSNIVTVTVG